MHRNKEENKKFLTKKVRRLKEDIGRIALKKRGRIVTVNNDKEEDIKVILETANPDIQIFARMLEDISEGESSEALIFMKAEVLKRLNVLIRHMNSEEEKKLIASYVYKLAKE